MPVSVGPEIFGFVVGAVVSLGASWLLVSRIERIGERFGFSEALLGLLAALAADTPEITAAVTALARHERIVGAGVVIGSNVFNLAALLGLGAVVAGRIDLHRRVILIGGAVASWVAILCLVSVQGVVSPAVGLGLMLAVLGPYVVVLAAHRTVLPRLPLPRRWVSLMTSAVDEEELDLAGVLRPSRGRPRDALGALAALSIVVAASVTMERTASTLGRHYAVPDVIVGGAVLAAVTSVPNVVAALYLATKKRGAATLSTALHSNSLNVVAGLMIPAAVIGVPGSSGRTTLMAGWYVGLTALTLGLAFAHRGVRRRAGWLIIAAYLAFVACIVVTS
jgi:cation:H+ antiporter